MTEEEKQARKRAYHIQNYNWQKANTDAYTIRFNKKTDQDIVAWLNHQPNRNQSIKAAIRYYFDREISK